MICFSVFILASIVITPVSGLKLRNIQDQNLSADLKIRKNGGDWKDDIVDTDGSLSLDFKITVETNREYILVGILVKLPKAGKSPMFNYDWGALGLGSSEPKPIFPIGEWTANDTDVCWAWYVVDASWSMEMTFTASIMKTGEKSVDLTVYGLKDVNGYYDECFDSVIIKADKTRHFHLLNRNINLFWKIILNKYDYKIFLIEDIIYTIMCKGDNLYLNTTPMTEF